MASLRPWHLLFFYCLFQHVAATPFPVPLFGPSKPATPDCGSPEALQSCKDEISDMKIQVMENKHLIEARNKTNAMLVARDQHYRNSPKQWLCGPREHSPLGEFPSATTTGILPRLSHSFLSNPGENSSDGPTDTSRPITTPSSNGSRSSSSNPTSTPSSNATQPTSPTESSNACSEYDVCQKATRKVHEGLKAQEITLRDQESTRKMLQGVLDECEPIKPTTLERRGDPTQMQAWNQDIESCNALKDNAAAYKKYQQDALNELNKAQNHKRGDHAVLEPRNMTAAEWDPDVAAKDKVFLDCQRALLQAWEDSSHVFNQVTSKWHDLARLSSRPKVPLRFPTDPPAPHHRKRSLRRSIHAERSGPQSPPTSIERRNKNHCFRTDELLRNAEKWIKTLETVIEKAFGQVEKAALDRSVFGFNHAECQWDLKLARAGGTTTTPKNTTANGDDKKELDDLREKNEALQKDKIDNLTANNKRLQDENNQLRKDNAQLQKEKEQLQKATSKPGGKVAR